MRKNKHILHKKRRCKLCGKYYASGNLHTWNIKETATNNYKMFQICPKCFKRISPLLIHIKSGLNDRINYIIEEAKRQKLLIVRK